MSKDDSKTFSSDLDDVIDIGLALFVGAITGWGAKLAWAKCISVQLWIAKGFFGVLAGALAVATFLTVAIAVIFFVELVKDYASRSNKE